MQFEILKNPGIDFYSGFRKTSQGGFQKKWPPATSNPGSATGIDVVETPDIVMWSPWSPMIANDRRVTAFVLSMLKTNAKVRRSNLERGENAVGSRRS